MIPACEARGADSGGRAGGGTGVARIVPCSIRSVSSSEESRMGGSAGRTPTGGFDASRGGAGAGRAVVGAGRDGVGDGRGDGDAGWSGVDAGAGLDAIPCSLGNVKELGFVGNVPPASFGASGTPPGFAGDFIFTTCVGSSVSGRSVGGIGTPSRIQELQGAGIDRVREHNIGPGCQPPNQD